MIKLEPRRCGLAVRCFLGIIASLVHAKKRPALEATVGFEPTNKGFANLCLTTWPRRLNVQSLYQPENGFQG